MCNYNTISVCIYHYEFTKEILNWKILLFSKVWLDECFFFRLPNQHVKQHKKPCFWLYLTCFFHWSDTHFHSALNSHNQKNRYFSNLLQLNVYVDFENDKMQTKRTKNSNFNLQCSIRTGLFFLGFTSIRKDGKKEWRKLGKTCLFNKIFLIKVNEFTCNRNLQCSLTASKKHSGWKESSTLYLKVALPEDG